MGKLKKLFELNIYSHTNRELFVVNYKQFIRFFASKANEAVFMNTINIKK